MIEREFTEPVSQAHRATQPGTQAIGRTDELAFRLGLPKSVDGIWLVMGGPYHPGSESTYASMRVITYRPGWTRAPFSLHTCSYIDDSGDPRWALGAGHYDLADLDTAKQLLAQQLLASWRAQLGRWVQ